MTATDINLDDILGELSCLEEQLEIQQEEFAKTSLPSSYAIVDNRALNRHATGNRNFSTDNNNQLDNGKPVSSASQQKGVLYPDELNSTKLSPQDVLCGASRVSGYTEIVPQPETVSFSRKSVDFDLSGTAVSPANNRTNGNVNKPNGRTDCLVYPSSGSDARRQCADDARGVREVSVGPNGAMFSGLSSRSSTQSFGSDAGASFGLLGSVNSVGTVSSQSGSHSSVSSSVGTGSTASPSSKPTAEQVLFRVYSPDGTSKTVAGDRYSTAGRLCEALVRKNRVEPRSSWALIEQVQDLYMERIIEDHQRVVDVVDCWVKDSGNRLMFVDWPTKYSMFSGPQAVTFEKDEYVPNIEGMLYMKGEGKKTWKKMYFVLRASGLYYSLKGKGNVPSDLVCLQALRDVEVFTAANWKKKHRSPTEFGFALKTAMIQKIAPKYIKYLCAQDEETFNRWVTALRCVKHGKRLFDNYRRYTLNLMSNPLTRSATLNGNDHSSLNHSRSNDEFNDSIPAVIKNGGSADQLSSYHEGGARQTENKNIRFVDGLLVTNNLKCVTNDNIVDENNDMEPVQKENNRVLDSIIVSKYVHMETDRTPKNIILEPLEKVQQGRGRSCSIDRILDDSFERVSKNNAHIRSNSSDRFLDGGSNHSSRFNPDSFNEDYNELISRGGTMRRSLRNANDAVTTVVCDNETSGSRTGTLRRNSSVSSTSTTPNKMVPRLPITTTVTRHMSMQQSCNVSSLTRQSKTKTSIEVEEGCDVDQLSTTSSIIDMHSRRGSSSGQCSDVTSSSHGVFSQQRFDVENAKSLSNSDFAAVGRHCDSMIGNGNERDSARWSSELSAGSSTSESNGASDEISVATSHHNESSRVSSAFSAVTGKSTLIKNITSNGFPSSIITPTESSSSSSTNEDSGFEQENGNGYQATIIRQHRVPSPDFPPPPPPEFLHAFQPSVNDIHGNNVKTKSSEQQFEAKLESELEFLEQQVSQLSNRHANGYAPTQPTVASACFRKSDVSETAGSVGFAKNSGDCKVTGQPVASATCVIHTLPSLPQQSSQFCHANVTTLLHQSSKSDFPSRQSSLNDSPDIHPGMFEHSLAFTNTSNYLDVREMQYNSPSRTNNAMSVQRDIPDNTCDFRTDSLRTAPVLYGSVSQQSSSGTLIRQKPPPAPPRRMESTKLSFHTNTNSVYALATAAPYARFFIDDLDRVITQKCANGVDGMCNLEMPLPPPPSVILDDLTTIDFGDLPPPPPAELLNGLRTLRRNNAPRVPPKRK